MKILYVTTISLTMNSFFKPHIKMLVDEGNQVDIACNCSNLALDGLYDELKCKIYQIDFSRSPFSPSNLKAYSQLKKIIKDGGYDIVHCHTPNASVVTRLACRKLRKKNGLKVFYTAHGFHFYKGAPLKNWLIYYPVEKLCSYFTDVLITINNEDYELAKRKMRAKRVEYVPGVGIDLSRFENVEVDIKEKRREIGVPEDAFLLLSVGELNENKNHRVIVEAIAKLGNPRVHYVVAGIGNRKESLLALAEERGVSGQVHLLGYRRDIPELNTVSNAFCFPSLREGLPIAPMEAMACGKPVISSDVRGISDYNIDGVTGYKCSPYDVDGFAGAIEKLMNDSDAASRMGEANKERVKRYSIDNVLPIIKSIYES